MLSTMMAVVGGGVITIMTVILVEYLRRPVLTIRTCNPQELDFEGQNRPARRMRIAHLELVNNRLPWWARWMSRGSAIQCHGTITFHHLDGQNIFGRAMSLRWGRSPEPVPVQIAIGDNTVLIHNPLLAFLQRMNVPAGEGEIFNVAARFDQDEECYGWSNECYFSDPQWRNPDWKLAKGRFLVKVTLNSSGEKCTGVFRLLNDVPVGDFRIEASQPGDVARD